MPNPSKDLLSISLNKLEIDCQNQPKLMWEWSEELVAAKKRTKFAKNKLKLKGAELDARARKDPEGEMNLEKATDKAVEYYVYSNREYQTLQEELYDAEEEEETLDLFVKAIIDRREEIGNLVKLHGQTYWSKPDTKIMEGDRDRQGTMRRANESIGKDSKLKKGKSDE